MASTRQPPPIDVSQIPFQALDIRNKFLHSLDRTQISVNASHGLPSMPHEGIGLFFGNVIFLKIGRCRIPEIVPADAILPFLPIR